MLLPGTRPVIPNGQKSNNALTAVLCPISPSDRRTQSTELPLRKVEP